MASFKKSRNWDKSKIIIAQAKEFFVKGQAVDGGRPGTLQGQQGVFFSWKELPQVIVLLEGEWWADEMAYDEIVAIS